MIFIGLLGVVISISCYWLAFPDREDRDPKLFALILAMHLGMTLLYWQYSLGNPADSRLYYYDWVGLSDRDVKAGSIFLSKIIATLRSTFGGTYLDYFFLFQAFGVAGISLLLRVFLEIFRDLGEESRLVRALLFLPGLHFWTSAIGKDAPLFFAVSLSIWAMLNIERRHWAFFIALLVMLPVRPHIAAIAVVSLIATLTLDRRVRPAIRVPLLAVAVVAASWIFATAQQTLSIQELSPESVDEFLASRQEYGMRTGDEGATIVTLPFPLKVASLLFRPMVFDAGGLFGIVVSVENIVLLLVFATIFRRFKELFKLLRALPYLRYCVIFASITITLLCLITYNVGLGLRQKFMVMPAVLVVFCSVITYRRAMNGVATAAATATRSSHDDLLRSRA